MAAFFVETHPTMRRLPGPSFTLPETGAHLKSLGVGRLSK
jgi:hypothetical protein